MAGTQREHGVHGSRPTPAELRCVLLGPPNAPTPPDLHESLEARGSAVTRVDDEYCALATLISMDRAAAQPAPTGRRTTALLLLQPDMHAERCAELHRAVQLYSPSTVVWQFRPGHRPSLCAYQPPEDPLAKTEAEHIDEARRSARASETPYEQAARASAPPSLRLVTDQDDRPEPASFGNRPDEEQDGLLSSDEIEMLMDPLFDTKPRRGSDPR